MPKKASMSPALSALLAIVALMLSACGGGSAGSGDGSPVAASAELGRPAATSCDGTVKDFFAAIEGRYTGSVPPDYSTGGALPLTAGKTYPVTLSAAHCSIEIMADGMVKLVYAYHHPANVSASSMTEISPTTVIRNPTALDLQRSQYSIHIETHQISLELERLIATSSADVTPATGDLRMTLSVFAPAQSSYALDMPLASKR
jgi:hypothetical protein